LNNEKRYRQFLPHGGWGVSRRKWKDGQEPIFIGATGGNNNQCTEEKSKGNCLTKTKQNQVDVLFYSIEKAIPLSSRGKREEIKCTEKEGEGISQTK